MQINKPCYLCKLKGHTTATCPFRFDPGHAAKPATLKPRSNIARLLATREAEGGLPTLKSAVPPKVPHYQVQNSRFWISEWTSSHTSSEVSVHLLPCAAGEVSHPKGERDIICHLQGRPRGRARKELCHAFHLMRQCPSCQLVVSIPACNSSAARGHSYACWRCCNLC